MSFLAGALPAALALLWSTALGRRVARPLLAPLSPEEKIGWGLGIGLLLQAAIFSALLLVRLEPRPILMVLYGILLALAVRGKKQDARPAPEIPRIAIALLAVAGIAWALFLLQSVVEPMWANDYLAIWGFKARTISLSSSIPQRLFRDAATPWSHPEYPLLLPLAFASVSALAGSWNDRALGLLYPALSASLLLALFGFFRRRGRPLGGAIAVLLASLFFFLFQAFEVGMAEIPLAFAIVLLASSAADPDERAHAGRTARAAVAAFLCCGLKQEGTLFVLLLAAGIALRMRADRLRRLILAVVLLAAAALNWMILRVARGPIADRDYDLSFVSPAKLPLLLSRLSAVGAAALRGQLLPIAVPAAAAALFLLLTPRSRIDWLLPVVGAQILAYFFVCALSSIDPLWQVQFVPRVSGVLFPLLCAVVGERSSLLFESGPVRVKVREK